MNSTIQQRINPPVPRSQLDFVKGEGKSLDPDSEDQVDFLKLLNNSNAETKLQREAKKNGDLSGAKNYDEFLTELEQQSKKLREPKNDLGKDDFLTLFVTQLQNQDPLSPEDSSEMASKLAQFNSLEQMLNVNKTLDKMLSSQNQSRSVGMVSYIGKEITVDGGRLRFKNGELNESSFNISRPASSASLEIRDESGVVVATKALGTLPAGEHSFKWDGLNSKGEKAGEGTYTYSVMAKGINDEEIPVSLQTKTKITGVDIKSDSGGLFTPLGMVALEDIRSIGESGYGANAEAKPGANKVDVPTGSPEEQIRAVAEKLTADANREKQGLQPGAEPPVAATSATVNPKPKDQETVTQPAINEAPVTPAIPKIPKQRQEQGQATTNVSNTKPEIDQPASTLAPG